MTSQPQSAVSQHALEFLASADYPLGSALVRHVTGDAGPEPVLHELAAFQLPDGGFRGLEVDIKAPVSNPFAARIAMLVLGALRMDHQELAATPLVANLERWLEAAQDEDGDWHFMPEIYRHELAPWFAGWVFPSLNPSAGLSGLARGLGIGSERLHARVRVLFDERATLEEAETGEFYAVMPYFEYLCATPHPEREAYLDALGGNVARTAESGGYADAEHFFVHVDAGGPDLAGRLPAGLIDQQLDRLAAAQEADGGWPSPYDQAWRPWSTTNNAVTLARHGWVSARRDR